MCRFSIIKCIFLPCYGALDMVQVWLTRGTVQVKMEVKMKMKLKVKAMVKVNLSQCRP